MWVLSKIVVRHKTIGEKTLEKCTVYHVTWVRVPSNLWYPYWSFGDGSNTLFLDHPNVAVPSFGTGYVDHWTMSFALGTDRRIDLHLGFHFHVWSTHRWSGFEVWCFCKKKSQWDNQPPWMTGFMVFFLCKIQLNHDLQLETFYMICNWKPFESCWTTKKLWWVQGGDPLPQTHRFWKPMIWMWRWIWRFFFLGISLHR